MFDRRSLNSPPLERCSCSAEISVVVGGDEVGGGEPGRQGQPGVAQDGAGRHRGPGPARPALHQIAGSQKVVVSVAARRAAETIRPAAGHELVRTLDGFLGEVLAFPNGRGANGTCPAS